VIFYIRRALRPAGGNQWYKDRSDRGQGTYCGAPETAYDVPHRDRNRAESYQLDGRELCPACRDIREQEKGAANSANWYKRARAPRFDGAVEDLRDHLERVLGLGKYEPPQNDKPKSPSAKGGPAHSLDMHDEGDDGW
jgi:hypothetical protein